MDKKTEEALNFYLHEIKSELIFRHGSKFRGNIDFQVNFVDGGLTGMSVTSKKNVKYIDKGN